MSRVGLRVLLAIGAFGTLAVPSVEGQTIPGFQPAGQSSRVRLFTRSASKPGRRERAALERTESYLGQLEKRLGQPLGGPIDYYRYERPEDIASQTGVYATGLTRLGDDIVHSTLDYHPHELVHAVAGNIGRPGRFFHEGLAVAIGDDGRWGKRSVHELARARAGSLTWPSLRDAFERLDADVAYPLAGSFVQHLIETAGLPRLVSFFRACGSDRPETAVAFRATYGRSLEDAVGDWQKRLQEGGPRVLLADDTPGLGSR